ncbi:hypothetical protein BU24DRAFT_465372 [Aaosphaeria arxii CBS 175.79]|uniref:Phosphoribosylaminoimidazole-succinocarboxamide synthase n=1 Tax=Aaosphaeria arxii CBS 175.79 TaxID=1450172 RepID=A0A6A5XJQ0_9PLEO|nr:uncharacterized protein BU24DRAFT_465372 [Aaosphaeria arxii CBS 175.79]KAF2013037.1 hypothetical protein BU24DRAFT_465372 [Aaosphaeria arxii CBS 175.79]
MATSEIAAVTPNYNALRQRVYEQGNGNRVASNAQPLSTPSAHSAASISDLSIQQEEPIRSSSNQHLTLRDGAYHPIDRPDDYPELYFRPLIIRDWALVVIFIFLGGCFGGLITLFVLDRNSPERLFARARRNHLATKYLPTVVGSITTIWWRAVSRAYLRILPYVRMASVPVDSTGNSHGKVADVTVSTLAQYDNDPSAIPAMIKGGHYLTLFVHLTTLITLFLMTPLKSGLLQITESETGWAVDVSAGVAVILIFLYLLLIVSTVGMFFKLYNRQTGLKWEPAALASQIALLQHINCRKAFAGSEFFNFLQAQRAARGWSKKFGVLRLGYWRQGETGPIVHGIRFIPTALTPAENRPSASNSRSNDRVEDLVETDSKTIPYRTHLMHRSPRGCHESPYSDREAPRDAEGDIVCSPEYVRYRFVNVWGSDFFLGFTAIAAAICIVVASVRIHDRGIHNRIDISSIVMEPNSLAGRFAISVIFSVLPALLFVFFSSIFFVADVRYRTTQGLHGMRKPQLAERNIFLDYISPNPFSLIPSAVLNGHYRVAWHSFLALTSNFSILVAGRIFNNFQSLDGTYGMVIAPTNFFASFAILCFYLLCLPYARPPAAYRTPRLEWMSILDTAAYVYDSPILNCEEFDVQDKTDKEQHLNAKILLAKRKYCFGMYRGLDGRRHMGVSPVEIRNDAGDMENVVDRFKVKWSLDLVFARWVRSSIVSREEKRD